MNDATHPEPAAPLSAPPIDELVDVAAIAGGDFGLDSDEARQVFALAQVMRSTAHKIGSKTPLGEQMTLKAVRLVYDAQNPGSEGRSG